jgi:hypothetical protein
VTDAQAQVRASFEAYERALSDGDVEAMNGWFLDDRRTTRFGLADEQWGAEEVRRWRAGAAKVPAGRTLTQTRVDVVGPSTVVVTTLFSYPGGGTLGRQSQTWLRCGEEWRIVHAHVSERFIAA